MAQVPQEKIRLMDCNRHMLDGIACLGMGEWEKALQHFDNAVQMRLATTPRDDADSAWALAGAWINRADALRFLGRSQESVESLDKAISSMEHRFFYQNPVYADRLILAWINRSTVCGEFYRVSESLAGFAMAEKLLKIRHQLPSPRRTMLESMLHANRARVLLDMGRAVGGLRDAHKAVNLLDQLDQSDSFTEAAIKARGILCRALALLLDEPDRTSLEDDWIARATDTAEEGLALVRSSGYRGEWVADLVRYGAKIYRVCQPHFLGGFIREWVGPGGPLAANEALKRCMDHELLLAKADLEQRVRARPHDTGYVQREMKILASLQFSQTQMAARAL